MVAVGGSAGGRGVQLVSPNYTHTCIPHMKQLIAPGETICPLPADGSLTCGGSTSVSRRVRSPLMSGGQQWLSCSLYTAAGSQCAYSLGQLCQGTDRQMDGRIVVSINAPPTARGITSCYSSGSERPDRCCHITHNSGLWQIFPILHSGPGDVPTKITAPSPGGGIRDPTKYTAF